MTDYIYPIKELNGLGLDEQLEAVRSFAFVTVSTDNELVVHVADDDSPLRQGRKSNIG